MSDKTPPYIDQMGEYGATRAVVTVDGSMTRIAFGRSLPGGGEVYYTAVHLSPEAVTSLIEQLKQVQKS